MNDNDFCSPKQVMGFIGYFWRRCSFFSCMIDSIMVRKANVVGYLYECDLEFDEFVV